MTTISAPAERITPEELLRMPDNSTLELVNGRIVEKNVSSQSSEVELWIGTRLTMFVMSHPIAKVFPASLGFQCFRSLEFDRDRIRKPDATVIRLERIATLPDPNPGYMPIVPDLAIEVFSPNDTAHEMSQKVQEYRAAGFPLIWVVEPDLRTITVFPNPGKPFLLSEDDEIRAESALPGFVCKVAELFPPQVLPRPPV